MLLLIDNYDSFTYNLVHYLGELGAEMVIRRNDALDVQEAMAMNPAGILLSLGLAAFLLLPKDTSLSAELVQHVADEPNSLYSRQALSPATIQLVAGRLGYRFNSPQTNISYAANCLVAGSQALHFTVQADHSSATLLLMPHQELNASHQFHQHHLHGRIVPLSRGSAAILSNDPAMLDQLEATTLQQLIF